MAEHHLHAADIGAEVEQVRGERVALQVYRHAPGDCYRKPCFAGDRVRVALQAFTRGDELGAFGAFVPEQGGKPHAYITMGAR